MSENVTDAPKVWMLPPTLVLMHICAGITLNWLVPISFGSAWGWLGLILLISAFGITYWAKTTFAKAGTNVVPNQPSTTIVKDGPFQYSRNPMYLSFLIGFAGLAMLADAPIMLLLLGSLYYLLDERIIIPEEEYLTDKFGEEYDTYCQSVRRWV